MLPSNDSQLEGYLHLSSATNPYQPMTAFSNGISIFGGGWLDFRTVVEEGSDKAHLNYTKDSTVTQVDWVTPINTGLHACQQTVERQYCIDRSKFEENLPTVNLDMSAAKTLLTTHSCIQECKVLDDKVRTPCTLALFRFRTCFFTVRPDLGKHNPDALFVPERDHPGAN